MCDRDAWRPILEMSIGRTRREWFLSSFIANLIWRGNSSKIIIYPKRGEH